MAPLKGIKLSEEHKRKISLSHRGKKLSEIHCKKLSLSHMGILQSEESKKKKSESVKKYLSENPRTKFSMTGKHHSEETKQKMRMSQLGMQKKKKNRKCTFGFCQEKHYGKGYCQKHYQIMFPRSTRKYGIDLQIAMNNVRKRDNNTCQWQGCGLTHRQAPIHVHHIFPRSEYPEVELVEQYMICYCANHHGLWHRYRGDTYYKWSSQPQNRINQVEVDQ